MPLQLLSCRWAYPACLAFCVLVPEASAADYDPPLSMVGSRMHFGKLPVPVGAELFEGHEHVWMGTWQMKDRERLAAFVRGRMRFIQDDDLFENFRASIENATQDGGDAAYGKWNRQDSIQMLTVMEKDTSGWGLALLRHALPRMQPRLDSVGNPHLIGIGGPFLDCGEKCHQSEQVSSPDVLNNLFKLFLTLRSLSNFADVPGQAPVPTPAQLVAACATAGGSIDQVPELLSGWDILEVGGGPGIPAAVFVAAMGARTYSIADLPTMQSLQRKVLARVLGAEVVDKRFVFVPTFEQFPPDWLLPSYDLFVSTYALSELHPKVRRRYFYALIVRSKRGFIIDNFEDLRPTVHGAQDPTDRGDFIGLDLVRRLQEYAFDVHIITYQQVLGLRPHRSRAVVITWASMGLESRVGIEGLAGQA